MFEEKLEILIKNILDKSIETKDEPKRITVDENLFNDLVQYLKSNEQIVNNFDDCSVNTGDNFSSVTLPSFAKWLVIYSNDHSIKESIESLKEYLEVSYIPGVSILAISGIHVEEKIQISDDIDLVPFDDLPFSRMKETLSPYILKKYLIHGPMSSNYNPPKAAFIKRVKLSPKSYKKNEKYDLQKINYSDLWNLCLFLTLHSNATPLPATNWTEPEEQIPCKNILDNHVSYPSFLELSREDVLLTKYDWERLKPFYHKFLCLSQQDKDHLKIPIQRLNQARKRLSYVDKAIDQGIAMEALFLNDKSGSEQISMTLRLRASLWLGPNIEEREEISRFFNAAYSCRSKAVHTGRLDKEVKISHKGKVSIEYILDESDNKCIEAIKKIIMNGNFPNWDRLLLGAGC